MGYRNAALEGQPVNPMKLAAAEFERLALEQLDLLYRIARRLTRDPNRAEDLVQETFVRALAGRDGFDLQVYGIRPWLLRIMHNLHLNRSQREKRQPAAMDDEHLEAAGSANSPASPSIPKASTAWTNALWQPSTIFRRNTRPS